MLLLIYYFLYIVSEINFLYNYYFLFIDLYLAFYLNDNFYDIVFDLIIDNDTYDFENGEYKNKVPKILWFLAYVICNAFVLLCFIYILIFILFPIILYRIKHSSTKPKKDIRVTEQIGSQNISLLKERLTSI